MIILWIILTNIMLATLILCGMKLFEFLSRPVDQDEDAFDRDPHHPLCRHAARPEEWEDFPQVNRVPQPQSGQASHEVEPPALNELLKDGLDDVTALRLYDLGLELAKSFAAKKIPIDFGDETGIVNSDLTMSMVGSGDLFDPESTVYWFATNSDDVSYFLEHIDEFLIDDFEKRISALVRMDLEAPLPVSKHGQSEERWRYFDHRSHHAKPKKDRQDKTWTSFDGRHMNCRKYLADLLND